MSSTDLKKIVTKNPTIMTSSNKRRPNNMTTGEVRCEVESLLNEMKRGCLMPLLDQVVVGETTETASQGRTCKRQRRHNVAPPLKHDCRPWDELVADASTLLPFMTSEEHSVVARLVSILFLGYLLPNSTGNEFFINHECYPKKHSTVPLDPNPLSELSESPSDADISSWFWRIPLEERLENSTRFYAAQEYGEIDVCFSEIVATAFHSFLTKGLAPFLARRPAPRIETDLIHLLAMAISPVVGASELEPATKTPRAKDLMQSRHAHYFHVHYKDRLQVVQLVVDNLVLPEQEDDATEGDSAMLDGALVHLRASLHAFGLGAMSPRDAHLPHIGLVNIAIQTGQNVLKEWDSLLNQTLQDVSDYGCSVCSESDGTNLLDTTFCVHVNRGKLMNRFVSKFNGSRHYADETFTRHALSSLTAAIQNELKLLEEPSSENENDESLRKSPAPPCLLASLLSAAKLLFYFFLPPPTGATVKAKPKDDGGDDQFADADESEDPAAAEKKAAEEDSQRKREQQQRDDLVQCATDLLRHSSVVVASEASSLLATALAYGDKEFSEKYFGDILSSVRLTFQRCFQAEGDSSVVDVDLLSSLAKGLESVIVVGARCSFQFASSLVVSLVSQRKEQQKTTEVAKDGVMAASIFRLIAAVALTQPKACSCQFDALRSFTSTEKDPTGLSHLLAAFLSCRSAHFFLREDRVASYQSTINEILPTLSDSSVRYKLAQHAMVTNNFAIAQEIFQDLLRYTSTEKSFLWLSALSKMSEAEKTLLENGARGVPSSTPSMHSALTYLNSLRVMDEDRQEKFAFQVEFLSLRIDFVDLCVTMRGLASELRLTGVVPKSSTRSGLHVQNLENCFYALASRYHRLYRRFGMFCCQQSRSAIRTIFHTCRFLGYSARKVFLASSGAATKQGEESASLWPKGDSMHPMTRLIRKLDELLVGPMNASIDPITRGAALLEVLEGVFLTPMPFPRGFTKIKSLPVTKLRLSADPNQTPKSTISEIDPQLQNEMDVTDAEVVDVYPGLSYTLFASGTVKEEYFKLSKLPFSHILAWYSVTYDGALQAENEGLMEDQVSSETKLPLKSHSKEGEGEVPPSSAPLLPRGNFFLPIECHPIQEEGFYKVDVTLGCRDLRCGEWEIATKCHTIFVRVAR